MLDIIVLHTIMGIVFIDGFDHYPLVDIGRKWTTASSSFGASDMVAGRIEGQALELATTSSFEKVFSTSSQAWRIGFALQLISTSTISTFQLMSIRDNTLGQVELSLLNNRRLQFSRNGTLVGSSSNITLGYSIWYYVEFYVSIKDSISSGNAQLYVNGIQEINLPNGTDIKNTTNSSGDRIRLSGGGFWVFDIDDLIVSQEADSTTPTFLGDRKITTLYPNSTGFYSSFNGSDGNSVDNYQLVNEDLIDDATYVASTTANNKDSYVYDNLTTSPDVVDAVQLVTNHRKDDVGSRTGRSFLRISASDYESDTIPLSVSYRMDSTIFTTNPSSSSSWNEATINALEAGVKVQS